MKVIVAVILAIGSASALGSGPYLPSGWKPTGPSFYLPSEIQKPVDNPLKETLLFETEASGSEGLREYGPPKIDVQALPDVVTEQIFYVVDSSALVEQQAAEVNVEQKAEIVQEATTESQVTIAAETKTQDFELDEVSTPSYEAVTDQVEVVTDNVDTVTDNVDAVTDKVETITELVEVDVVTDKTEIVELVAEVKEVKDTVAAVEEKLNNIVVQEVKHDNIIVQDEEKIEQVVSSVESVRNIAEALVNIENEIKAEQENIETVGELKVTENGSGFEQVPEGFLEYGPPGFREYGPPKGDEILKSISENEVRRRRFSPKFRSLKNKNQ